MERENPFNLFDWKRPKRQKVFLVCLSENIGPGIHHINVASIIISLINLNQRWMPI